MTSKRTHQSHGLPPTATAGSLSRTCRKWHARPPRKLLNIERATSQNTEQSCLRHGRKPIMWISRSTLGAPHRSRCRPGHRPRMAYRQRYRRRQMTTAPDGGSGIDAGLLKPHNGRWSYSWSFTENFRGLR